MKWLTVCILLLPFLGITQKNSGKEVFRIIPKELSEKIHLPFAAIEVMDARFDQSNIGCILNRKGLNLVAYFPDSLHRYLPSALPNIVSLNKESSDTLMILVKRFRLADYKNPLVSSNALQLIFNFSASFYRLKNSSYTRLFSIDKTVEGELLLTNGGFKDFPSVRSDAFLLILQHLLQNRQWQAYNSPAFSSAQIKEGILKRWSLPIVTDSVFAIGIYKNFDEFKQNKPSHTNIHVFYTNGKVDYVTDAENKKLDLSNAWGMCNGQKKYILFRGEMYELLPSDKSFLFLSYKLKGDLTGSASFADYATQMGWLPALIYKSSDSTRLYQYFQLNMETGEVHLEEIFGTSSLKEMQKELLK